MMFNKCCAFGCTSGNETCDEKNVSMFSFPFDRPVLLERRKSLLIVLTGNLQNIQ